MLLICLAGKPRLEQLDAGGGLGADQPSRVSLLARSFKTDPRGSGSMRGMAIDRLAAFFVFAVVAAITPGPSNLMLTAAGAQAGVVRGLPCLLGVTTGMGAMMFVVPLGLGRLVLGHPGAQTALRWGGAAFLLWLSWKIATSGGRVDSTRERAGVGYVSAAIFQWINPKSWLVSLSAAATFLGGHTVSPLGQAAAFGGLFMAAALPSGFVWLAFGAGLQRVLRDRRRQRVFDVAMGALLASSIVFILF
jgi:threonine/homoserine/homoserine lactone efflux protein